MNALKHYRREALLSQAQIASQIGVTQQYVGLLETGRRAGSWRTHKRLARVLGVSESVLFPNATD